MVKVDDAAGTPVAACGVAQSGRTPANETFPTEDLAEDSTAALAEEPLAAALAEVAAAPELAKVLAEVAEVLAEGAAA